ncbi:hypothetical protein [Nocardia africana]
MITLKPSYAVSLYDGEDANGVSDMVGPLLEQNLENFPSRIKYARKISRPIAVYNSDSDSACTIVFGTDEAVVYNDVVGTPVVTVIATIDQILDVSQLRMKAGGLVPVGFFTKRGFRVLGAILTHKLIVKGLLTHTLTALRTIALVSIVES